MERAGYDLVCIGGGGAAVLAAVQAADAGKSVALVCKDYPGSGNTRLAVGMTACPGLLAGDSEECFSGDLLRSGEGINEPAAVKSFAAEASPHVAALEELGLLFLRGPDGEITSDLVEQIGGHSRARSIANLGGGVSLGAYLKGALWRRGITVYSSTAVLELAVIDNRVRGLLALDLRTGQFTGMACETVLLATGGCSALYYPHTTNSRGAVGDGLTLALKAGAVLWDMEQIQAIPFGLTHPRSMIGALCGEPATAGPAGRLLDGSGSMLINGGINKMTRAAVTRIMMTAIARGRTDSHGGLLLDLKPNLDLPGGEKIYSAVRKSGISDIVLTAYGRETYRWEKSWSVMPAFHYQMGGIKVNRAGETGIGGLLAAGEIRAGLHGGNRLGSVALTEVYTSGIKAGQAAGRVKDQSHREITDREELEKVLAAKLKDWEKRLNGRGSRSPARLRSEIESCMWALAGPLREETKLLAALDELDRLSSESVNLRITGAGKANRQILDAVELHLMLPAARAVVLSALERRESRGAHLRADFPGRDDLNFRCHTSVRVTADDSLAGGLDPLES